jgi:hypothetical protein
VRVRITPGVILVALLAGSAMALLGAILWRGHVSGTRLLLIWACGVLPTLLIAAWVAGRTPTK